MFNMVASPRGRKEDIIKGGWELRASPGGAMVWFIVWVEDL
jgi:hypothetical protein